MGSWNIHVDVRFTFVQAVNWGIYHGKDFHPHKSFPTTEYLTSQSDIRGGLKCCPLLQKVWQHLNAPWLNHALIGWPLKSSEPSTQSQCCCICSASEGFSSLNKYPFHFNYVNKKSCEELYSVVTFLAGPSAYKKQYHRNRAWDIQLL